MLIPKLLTIPCKWHFSDCTESLFHYITQVVIYSEIKKIRNDITSCSKHKEKKLSILPNEVKESKEENSWVLARTREKRKESSASFGTNSKIKDTNF
jgi:hypothetical protein